MPSTPALRVGLSVSSFPAFRNAIGALLAKIESGATVYRHHGGLSPRALRVPLREDRSWQARLQKEYQRICWNMEIEIHAAVHQDSKTRDERSDVQRRLHFIALLQPIRSDVA